jgi:hypothetical protein
LSRDLSSSQGGANETKVDFNPVSDPQPALLHRCRTERKRLLSPFVYTDVMVEPGGDLLITEIVTFEFSGGSGAGVSPNYSARIE